MIDTSHVVEPFGKPVGGACCGFGSLDMVADDGSSGMGIKHLGGQIYESS